MAALRIAVAGASGRMGRMLIDAVLDAEDMELAAALDMPGSTCDGRGVQELVGRPCDVRASTDLDSALAQSDVLIDFTRPEGTRAHLAACVRHGVKLVIGTTGFNDAGKAAIAESARHIAIVFAPNMSVGVNVVFKLIAQAAKALAHGYDIEVIEAHHRHKVDAPSGTAIHMGEIVAGALGRNLSEVAVYGREGVTGEREPSTIGFATVRGGDIVGDHTVLFAGIGERIEITHRAGSRAGYTAGALRAARFLAQRTGGLYDMQDVLGLRNT